MLAGSEIHGAELPGHYAAAADSAKETALLLIVLWTLFSEIGFLGDRFHWFSLCFLFGWLFWRFGRSALLGWARLERLHRLIEEERWEIEHHRAQEKEELLALYEVKGFSGRLLDEVVETLMSDDDRLLQVMLEEELGLALESYEHPLKQAFGAALGVIFSALLLAASLFFLPVWGPFATGALIIALSGWIVAVKEKNHPMTALVWNLAIAAFAAFAAYLFGKIAL